MNTNDPNPFLDIELMEEPLGLEVNYIDERGKIRGAIRVEDDSVPRSVREKGTDLRLFKSFVKNAKRDGSSLRKPLDSYINHYKKGKTHGEVSINNRIYSMEDIKPFIQERLNA